MLKKLLGLSIYTLKTISGIKPSEVPIVYLDFIGKCNSICQGCIFGADKPVDEAYNENLTIDQILSLKGSLIKLKTKILSLGGGEPLLQLDVDRIVQEFTEIGISVHINTNGILLSKERTASLVNSGLRNFNISLDHYKPDKYLEIRGVEKVERVVDGIRNLNEVGVKPAINIVVSKKNERDLEDIVNYILTSFDVCKIQFIPINNSLVHKDIGEESFKEKRASENQSLIKRLLALAKLIEKNGIETNSEFYLNNFMAAYQPGSPTRCYAGSIYLTIDHKGYVGPCYSYMLKKSIRDTPLEEIIKSDEYKSSLEKVSSCEKKCWDVGTAEPSIRLRPGYLLRNIKSTIQEAKRYLS